MNRDSCVEKRDGQRAARGWQHCWREHAGENRRVRLIGQNETIAGAMYSPRLLKDVLKALGKQLVDDGRLDSVSLYSAGPTADFPELDTQEWQEDDYDQQKNTARPNQGQGRKKRGNRWSVKKAKAL